MLSYVSGGLEQVGRWEVEVPKLGHALGSLRAQLAGASLAPGTEVAVADLDAGFDVLTKNQRHLDEFVADVAHGLLKADGYYQHNRPQPPEGPTGILTAPDTAIDAGPADRELALVEGAEADAEVFAQLLEDAGITEAFDDYPPGSGGLLQVYGDLAGSAEFGELIAWMEQAGTNLEDPFYATAFYNALGAQGILATGTVLAAYADHNPGDEAQNLAEPFTTGFAAATWALDPEVTAQLLDLGAVTDWETQSVHLATMLTAPGDLYHPRFLADAADAIFFHSAGRQNMEQRTGNAATVWLPHTLALQALAHNPAASTDFANRSEDHFNQLTYPPEHYDIYGEDITPQYTTWLHPGINPASPTTSTKALHDLWSAAVYLNAQGVPLEITYTEQRAEIAFHRNQQTISMALDLTPLAGEYKLWWETANGKDMITGEPITGLNRVLHGIEATIGTILWFFPARGLLRNPTHNPKPTPPTTLTTNIPHPPQQPPTRTPLKRTIIHWANLANTATHGLGPDIQMVTFRGETTSAYRNLGEYGFYRDRMRLADMFDDYGLPFDRTMKPGTPEFDRMLSISDGFLIWVVRTDGTVWLAPRRVGMDFNVHTGLITSSDGSVLAAGEIRIVGSDGRYRAFDMDNHSGHFRPRPDSVEDMGVPLFEEQYGIQVESVGNLWG